MPGVRVVALDRDVLEVEGVELADRRVQDQPRQRPRLTGQLEAGLVEVVHVEVRVAQRVHEVADLEGGTWATMWVSRAYDAMLNGTPRKTSAERW